LNRWERHVYEKNLAKAMEDEEHLRKLAEARELITRINRSNEEEARANSWHIHYDYAAAFDGPLRPNGGW